MKGMRMWTSVCCSEFSWRAKTSYIICGTQDKLKMQGPCSKINKNFKLVTADYSTNQGILLKIIPCTTAWVCEVTHSCSWSAESFIWWGLWVVTVGKCRGSQCPLVMSDCLKVQTSHSCQWWLSISVIRDKRVQLWKMKRGKKKG